MRQWRLVGEGLVWCSETIVVDAFNRDWAKQCRFSPWKKERERSACEPTLLDYQAPTAPELQTLIFFLGHFTVNIFAIDLFAASIFAVYLIGRKAVLP